jgi:hypothetical protein
VDVLGTRQRLQIGEFQLLPALAADAGLQQFVAPLPLARGLAGARHRHIRAGRLLGFF